jgi:hypothetical protein
MTAPTLKTSTEPPTGRSTPARHFPWPAVLALLGALLLGALLNASELHESATTMEPGWQRNVMVALTGRLADVSHALRLDLPRRSLDQALGRGSTATTVPPITPPVTLPPTTTLATTIPATTIPPTTAAPQPPEPTQPPPTTLPGVFPPTSEHPARLWVTGDSLTERFGPSLVNAAIATGALDASREVEYSSGLTRPDFFDWPAHLTSRLDEEPTDILVFMIGANDGQPIHTEAGWVPTGTEEWATEYRRRVAETMGLLALRVPTVYWIGQPIARSADYSEKMAVMNRIYRSEAERHPNIRYVDTWDLFSDDSGAYSAYLPDASGRVVLMRAGDGIHLTPDGGDHLAAVVLQVVAEDWDLAG